MVTRSRLRDGTIALGMRMLPVQWWQKSRLRAGRIALGMHMLPVQWWQRVDRKYMIVLNGALT